MLPRNTCVWSLVALAVTVTYCSAQEPRKPSEPAAADKGEANAVKRAFEAYRSALLEQDGEAAASSVSKNTIKLYQEHRDLAVKGDEKTIKNLSLINRMQVLLLRHRVEPKLLKELDGKAVFGYAVDRNWIGKKSVVRVGLQDVEVRGPRAIAKVAIKGKATGEVFHFVKEGGDWKLDLVPTLQRTDQVLQRAVRNSGLSENEFIFSLISSVSGRRVSDEIWRPLE